MYNTIYHKELGGYMTSTSPPLVPLNYNCSFSEFRGSIACRLLRKIQQLFLAFLSVRRKRRARSWRGKKRGTPFLLRVACGVHNSRNELLNDPIRRPKNRWLIHIVKDEYCRALDHRLGLGIPFSPQSGATLVERCGGQCR